MDLYRFEDESDTVYNYRLEFIKRYTFETDINVVIKYSKIAANIKFKNCKYDSIIYNKLKEYI